MSTLEARVEVIGDDRGIISEALEPENGSGVTRNSYAIFFFPYRLSEPDQGDP